MEDKKIKLLRKTGIAEGISFLVLLLVCMPLKYFAGIPQAVTYFGWLHGLLFIAFVGMAYAVKEERHKPLKWFALAFAVAWLPLGTFWWDKKEKWR
jgi:integral membrane protein